MEKLLTIGMATYDDFDGVFFTIQALRMYHLQGIENDVEFIVIDNNPIGKHAKEVRNICNSSGAKYIPITNKTSTSVRNEIFKHATGKYVLCTDSHVLFETNAIKNLLEYYKENPDTKNLIQGPLWYDDLNNYSTHFDPIWRDKMFGIWATNTIAFKNGKPFEIPMMGLGMFSCKRSEWQGFNEHFKGFGGEEGYIHEKFRQAGGKCICIPTLRWNHRFGRPLGVPYSNKWEDRVWNYFVGWLELTRNIKHPIFNLIKKEFDKAVPTDVIEKLFQEAKTLYDL